MYLVTAFRLVLPSLCLNHLFYTIGPLKGASMISTMEFLTSFLHEKQRLDVGDCYFPCQIGQHLNACCEKNEDGKSGLLLNPPKLYVEQRKAILNGDDGCTTSTTTVEWVVKPNRNTFREQCPQDPCHIVALEKL